MLYRRIVPNVILVLLSSVVSAVQQHGHGHSHAHHHPPHYPAPPPPPPPPPPFHPNQPAAIQSSSSSTTTTTISSIDTVDTSPIRGAHHDIPDGISVDTTIVSGPSTTVVSILQIGSGGSGALTIVSKSSGKPDVYYTGAPISGTAELPPAISEVVFPTLAPEHPFPIAGRERLGINALPQKDTNGQSPLGSFDAPKFPRFVGGSANSKSGFPWGNRNAKDTNPYSNPPDTGVTRSYNFVVARATLAPDGVKREVLLVNGQFPGPTIEADWGDTIDVTVTNSITSPKEGTALHWHGLLQTKTPWEDGVPGITQCPIAPGQTYKYSFIADLYGTSWWHSHYSAQYAGGAFGAMIIHGPTHVDYDEDLGPIMLFDYFHNDYTVMTERTMSVNLDLATLYSDNNLINGKGDFNCSLLASNTSCTSNAGYSKFQFKSGKSYRLRLINSGAEGIQKFSIDKHTMKVMAYDFVPIVPYTTNIVTLGIGQRADVIVTANGSSTDAVWMRSVMTSCALTNQPYGYGIIYYDSANTTAQPTSTAWTDTTDGCANDALSKTVPYHPISPGTPATTVTIDLGFTINSTGNFLWTMDGSSFRVNYNRPVLDLANLGNYTYDKEWNVYDFGSNSSFRIVINNKTPVAHPMHIHGHNMFILNEGTGTWGGSIVNPNNTMRRDVQMLQPSGYMVLQVDADNPGVWPFHCHIAWHVSGGLYVNILERPSDVKNMTIPATTTDLCTSWDVYTKSDVVGMIDSGLRKKRDMRRAIRHKW